MNSPATVSTQCSELVHFTLFIFQNNFANAIRTVLIPLLRVPTVLAMLWHFAWQIDVDLSISKYVHYIGQAINNECARMCLNLAE